MKKIYLASSSPRRKELLTKLVGNNFEIIKSDYEEDNTLAIPPKELSIKHALGKGRAAAKGLTKGIVISADTFVVHKGEVLGKPTSPKDAKKQLEQQSGQTIEVITGYAVINVETRKEITGYEISKIQMHEITLEHIEAYIKTGEPLDKAGSFGIQGMGALFIKKMEGDYFNIMGLPIFKLHQALSDTGISVFKYLL